MKALTYQGPQTVQYAEVPDPVLADDFGAIVRVTATGICGSDLHIYAGHGFSADTGFCVGHEAVGEVAAVGSRVTRFHVGDRVLVPASVGCSMCEPCRSGRVSICQTRPGGSSIACYGLSSQLQGSQAESLAVPFADVNLARLPAAISDAAGVVLADNAATAWYGCRRARIEPGDSVLVIGLGPVGLMAAQSAIAMGAGTVFGTDPVSDRRERATAMGVVALVSDDPRREVQALTGGAGPDVVVEAVGADSTISLALRSVRVAGRVSVIGVSQNKAFPFHMELAQVKEIEFAIGLCSVQYELPTLLRLTASGRIDPEAVVSHELGLSEGPDAYRLFANRADGVCKIILDPAC
jgi:alcohol dehydrogenase